MTSQSFYRDTLRKLQNRTDLGSDEAERLLRAILEQQLTEVQIAVLLVALAAKGESCSEIVGFARGMRQFAVRLSHRQNGLVDTAGTGGDASGTFNISTCAAFVIAGAGVPVAKHGNRAMSGRCGSADVLAHLGVNIDAPKPVLEDCLERCGITFLFAAAFHPAMKALAKLRRELGIRTVFNLLGPMLNPAGTRRQIVGVFSPQLTEVLAETLLQLGCDHALVFSDDDGLDEISVSTRTKFTEVRDGALRTHFITPEDLGVVRSPREAVLGGDVEQNARMLRAVLENTSNEARRDVVLMNAAAGIYVSGRAQSLREGMDLARKSLSSGQALDKLEMLVRLSNQSTMASGQ